jgi:hypothetical protein
MPLFADSLWQLIAILAVVSAVVFCIGYLLRDSRILSVCPRIQDFEDRLIARTSWRGWLLSLTLLSRQVVVDANANVNRRLFWFIREQRSVAFDAIEGIYYLYEDWGFFTSLGFLGNSKDLFTVKLQLIGGEKVHLFSFWGEGTFQQSPYTPWWAFWWRRWWDEHVDASGSQERDSRQFVRRLQDLTGAPLL